jgi:hypothetical protein
MDERIVFTGNADWEALHKAEQWCRDNGYSYGALQADAPTGIVKGDADIAKWRNLSHSDRLLLDGRFEAPGRTYRTGPVTAILKPSEAVTA